MALTAWSPTTIVREAIAQGELTPAPVDVAWQRQLQLRSRLRPSSIASSGLFMS